VYIADGVFPGKGKEAKLVLNVISTTGDCNEEPPDYYFIISTHSSVYFHLIK